MSKVYKEPFRDSNNTDCSVKNGERSEETPREEDNIGGAQTWKDTQHPSSLGIPNWKKNNIPIHTYWNG